jgi:conjugative relaxase-like TrwC/TraI family protein
VTVAVGAARRRDGGGVISIRRVSLGGGFRYLMDSVAAGDEATPRPDGLTAYYAASGTPPGRFLGAGLADLDRGNGIAKGTLVTEEHLYRMLVALADPVSGEPLGGAPYMPTARSAPVAGFDLTFSPSKSVSVAWALADPATQAVIAACHDRAVETVLAWAERNVFRSRSGKNGVVEEDVTGAIATAFSHFASRADDPQLHDHVVVWNRAKSVSDGRWRTLDSRSLFKAVTTLSEMHQGVLADLLTERLGVGWEPRSRRHSERPRFEIAGVSEDLMAEFSTRSGQVAEHAERLVAEFVATNGRQPTAVEQERLRQRATIATRPAKTRHSLAALTDHWRQRADPFVPIDEQKGWGEGLLGRNTAAIYSSGEVADELLAKAAEAVVAEVSGRRSAYGRMNLLAEAHRVLQGVRFGTPADRFAVAEAVTDLAIARSLRLSPPPLCHTPAAYLRADGSSRLSPEHHVLYTTEALLEAEARLLDAGREGGGPVVRRDVVAVVTARKLPGREHRLGVDQGLAIEQVATSGRVLDVLCGPAGAGKSSAMAGVRAVWDEEHGPGSVVGLAPSAAAAEVLADELGIATENTAKWLVEHRKVPALVTKRERLAINLVRHPHPASQHANAMRARLSALEAAIAERRLRPDQLVVVDEASLAGTLALDEIVTAAKDAGAKVLLVGDWGQLGAVEAGGAFSLLVRDRGDRVPELCEVRRFTAEWERSASVALRSGEAAALAAYAEHDRIEGGAREELLDVVHAAWRDDVATGKTSLMLAADGATVAELNRLARAGRVAAGEVTASGLALAGGGIAGVGDEAVTRRNDRSVSTGRGFVRNGDRFVVTATNDDGSMAVRRCSGGREVTLSADYVAEHVELAYATTCHRSQGRTTDTAHLVVSPATTRELLYVAATRGRESNRLYVETAYDPDPATGHDALTPEQAVREVLAGVLANVGAETSAHEAMAQAQQRSEDFATLAAEYETLAQVAVAPRYEAMLERAGLRAEELTLVRASDAHGPLVASLRDAEARGLDLPRVLPRLVGGSFEHAHDVAAVLHGRVEQWAERARPGPGARTNLVAGLYPRAVGVTDPDLAQALDERDDAITRRARHLAEKAVARGDLWTTKVGSQPLDPRRRVVWLNAVATIAAYRERWDVTDRERPFGPDPRVESLEQSQHRRCAVDAARRAVAASCERAAAAPAPMTVAGPDFGADMDRGVDL